MAGRSSALRGNDIELTAIFLNANGDYEDPSPLSGLKLSIYPPGHDPRLGDQEVNAWIRDATLTDPGTGDEADPDKTIEHTSTGKFKYTFTVPVDADVGPAFDRWQATVDQQALDETFTFVVVGGGSIGTTQLYKNNMVFIKLHSTIAASDGTELGDDYEFYFTTEYEPLYTSIRRVRLDLGAVVSDIPDDTINLAIFEASIEANALMFGQITTLSSSARTFFKFARRQYVTCLAELILLGAIAGGESATGKGKSKRLADLDVSYGGGGNFDDLLRRAMSCMAKWEATLTSSGEIGPGTSQKPSMVVKGSQDPDRPGIGRGWESTSTYDTESQYPAANVRSKQTTQRRWKRDFKSSWRWGSRFSKDYD